MNAHRIALIVAAPALLFSQASAQSDDAPDSETEAKTEVDAPSEAAAPEGPPVTVKLYEDGYQKRDYDVEVKTGGDIPVVRRDRAEPNAFAVSVDEEDGVFVYRDDEEKAMLCDVGFATLRENLLGLDGMELVTESDSQEAYMKGAVSFTLTKSGHEAHPVIVRREIVPQDDGGAQIDMSACGYENRAGTEALLSKFAALNKQYELRSKFALGQAQATKATEAQNAPKARNAEDEAIKFETKPAKE